MEPKTSVVNIRKRDLIAAIVALATVIWFLTQSVVSSSQASNAVNQRQLEKITSGFLAQVEKSSQVQSEAIKSQQAMAESLTALAKAIDANTQAIRDHDNRDRTDHADFARRLK